MTHPKNNEYQAKWYSENRDFHNHQMTIRVKARKEELRIWFRDLKSQMSCARCGEDNPVCLDFHHREPSEKTALVSQVISKGWGKERIMEEIAKCTVLCANCHRKEHACVA